MAAGVPSNDFSGGNGRRWVIPAIGGILLLLIGYFIYQALTDVRGVAVPAPPQTVIDMLPPPPPPPPPPEPTPDKPPEPTEAPTPVPTPAPTPEAPAPMQIDSAAQAGSDSFGLQAGGGGGLGAPSSAGTCVGPNCGKVGGIGDAFYTRYLSGALQEKIQRENRVNRFVFSADFSITISPSGHVAQVSLLRSSGDAKRDEILLSVLQAVGGLDAPPASIRFPQKITVRGRRSL